MSNHERKLLLTSSELRSSDKRTDLHLVVTSDRVAFGPHLPQTWYRDRNEATAARELTGLV
jgi:hypothetical protein